MANPLFSRFGNQYNYQRSNNVGNNIISQLAQIKRNPGAILDILLQSGKINQQQYNELQPMRNNPQQIVNYLASHGNASQINQAQQIAGQIQ